MTLVALNKPYGTMCQFSAHPSRPTLADHLSIPGIYPAGRLDADSEGLLLLTDDGGLQARIAEPRHKLPKRYWAQVEGAPSEEALARLARGVDLGDFMTAPARIRQLGAPSLIPADGPEPIWPRTPPVRFRAAIPTTWIELTITEGKNRQVRRMTAAVGLPTLRLVRVAIGTLDLFALDLAPGAHTLIDPAALWPDTPRAARRR